MNRKHIFLLGISLLISITIACKKDKLEPTSYDVEILNVVNAHRTELGLQPFEHNDFIWNLAREHSADMANAGGNANHDGIEERYNSLRSNFGIGAPAENVASGNSSTVSTVVDSWLGSISLRDNIEGNYKLTGISAMKSENGTWYYTQIFFNQ